MGRQKKAETLDKAMREAVEHLRQAGLEVLANRVEAIRHDAIMEKTFSTTADIYFVDKQTGESVKVSNNMANMARLKADAPETYAYYKAKMLEFLGCFKDDSVFVQMYGRHGENLFPEEGTYESY